MRRRFRVSNYQSSIRIQPFQCSMPIGLNIGWNQIKFNLQDLVRRTYGSSYLETIRLQIHANCLVRRIYFSDRLYPDEELPPDFKLTLPLPSSSDKHAAVAAKRATMDAEKRTLILEKISRSSRKKLEPAQAPSEQ